MGLSEAVLESVASTSLAMHPHFYLNVILTGGNVAIPGFVDRIKSDVRSMAPIDFDVEVKAPKNPITYAWEGGAEISKSPGFVEKFCVTKSEYEEHGRSICSEKFDGF
eukprot:gene5166-297_t